MGRIVAAGGGRAPAGEVFAFLSDLRNHWRLTGRWIALDGLSGPEQDPTGGTVVLRGPPGLKRTLTTSEVEALAPRQGGGVAQGARRPRARVVWTVDHAQEGSRVALEATILAAGRLDALLLRAGARRWLERRFADTIARLDEHVPALAAL